PKETRVSSQSYTWRCDSANEQTVARSDFGSKVGSHSYPFGTLGATTRRQNCGESRCDSYFSCRSPERITRHCRPTIGSPGWRLNETWLSRRSRLSARFVGQTV